MFIDNTYISTLDELRAIIKSHVNNQSENMIDSLHDELIESYEDKTDTGLLYFVETLQTDEAKEYTRLLTNLNAYWNSLSSSEQYNALVAFFNVSPKAIDVMKYIEFLKSEIQEEDNKINVSIDVQVTTPANENIQFEIKLYEGKNLLYSMMTNKQSLAVSPNQILHFAEQISQDVRADKLEICLNKKVIDARQIGNVLSFSVAGVTFYMLRVKGGNFIMGSNNGNDNEKPEHEVRLSDFFIADRMVGTNLWRVIMDKTSDNKNSNSNPFSLVLPPTIGKYLLQLLPKTDISWHMCKNFIEKLNEELRSQLYGKSFDFLTEAQWEYAVKMGKIKRTVFSATRWEWCKDKYNSNLYSKSEATADDPICSNDNLSYYVVRGGILEQNQENYITERDYWGKDYHSFDIGLRLALRIR